MRRTSTHNVKIEDYLTGIDIRHLSKHSHHYLIKLMSEFKAYTAILYIANNEGYSDTSCCFFGCFPFEAPSLVYALKPVDVHWLGTVLLIRLAVYLESKT